MNIFELRSKLITDYSEFVRGFIKIRDQRISDLVEQEMNEGLLWPDPLIQLNPFYEPGESIKKLIEDKALDPLCDRIFRVKEHENDPGSQIIRLYRHQSEAIHCARTRQNYVLTTGTGSGKSLAYIIPIVDLVLREGSGKGIKAVIVYPMNALANSQEIELQKFINYGFPGGRGPVIFRRYTGQESRAEKAEICANPPDILLTNYVMLEYILTRPEEVPLVRACRDLRFLVLDELHTYRGRQGADVAMLIRRTREATGSKHLICVGTSATLSSAGNLDQQKLEIARVASLIFGSEVRPQNVIGEYLQRLTLERDFQDPLQVKQLLMRVETGTIVPRPDFEALRSDPLASWIETTFGLDLDSNSQRLVRAKPKAITGSEGGAELLSRLTGLDVSHCQKAIQDILLLGSTVLNPESGFPIFAFKLHQFISRGDTVYASLEAPDQRYLTVQRQLWVPNSLKDKLLLPLAFCRECGQEYYSVFLAPDEESGGQKFIPRGVNDRVIEQQGEPGYLYWAAGISSPNDVIPPDWKDADGRIISSNKRHVPKAVKLRTDGTFDRDGNQFLHMGAPFKFCPHCGISYSSYFQNDFPKLSALGTEGRSTATTVLSMSAVRHIREMELDPRARKLLSFTDNRQDASLQAGHFNDFVRVGLIRGALYHALQASPGRQLRLEQLCHAVFNSLALELKEYSDNPDIEEGSLGAEETKRALRDVLGYLLFQDLKRGWRITAPNLEQTGLLSIGYLGLEELASDDSKWEDAHPALAKADPDARRDILHTMLDQLRRELAINVTFLIQEDQEKMLQRRRLNNVWGFDESISVKQLAHASYMLPRSKSEDRSAVTRVYLSPQGSYARYLRRHSIFNSCDRDLDRQAIKEVMEQMLQRLCRAGILKAETIVSRSGSETGYQLEADAILWKAGDGTHAYHDPTRVSVDGKGSHRINSFFKEYYTLVASSTHGFRAGEHTAQVSYEEREKREQSFREATLPILYCSPTMELGIDISSLTMVNMRNIPPTPANYAQRGGRAGRGGQPALIFSYCSSGSPHDQYFYKRPLRMVSGSVATPQIELANEELLRSHLYAIWLTQSGMSLKTSLAELLNIEGDPPSLELLEPIREVVYDPAIRDQAKTRAAAILAAMREHLETSTWYDGDWLSRSMNELPTRFEEACSRWRDLYRSAVIQREEQHRRLMIARNKFDRDQAERLRREAEAQIELLRSTTETYQSDFYSYRYFASEGFLPGYSFPRLPLSAFIPGKRTKRDDYLSRPRFLAITEFGPRSLIYHEGSRYRINQVILPMQEGETQLSTISVKLCANCGYRHEDTRWETCENCGSTLLEEQNFKIEKLLRLQNVVAKRVDQINCDEEERLRLGFDIRGCLRFASRVDGPSKVVALLMNGQQRLATLSYGDAAEIWRINLGMRKRRDGEPNGFLLDLASGFWVKTSEEESSETDEITHSRRTERVKPYVSDHKNCLLLEPDMELLDSWPKWSHHTLITTLQYALKNAIQHVFELEDNELAAEPLPTRDNRRTILLYEAAEGGAGVLKRLLDPDDLKRVLREALELCHFDPDTLEDRDHGPFSHEACEAGCYDCLLSYYNQSDHGSIDRKSIAGLLGLMRDGSLELLRGFPGRLRQYQLLCASASSPAARLWLDHLYQKGFILPDLARYGITAGRKNAYFVYNSDKDARVAVFIDPPEADQSLAELDGALMDAGWWVIHFAEDQPESWQRIISENSNVFGSGT